jgi:predicted CoA-substrate-specific enzyme activase
MKEIYLGIDIGSTTVKVVMINRARQLLAQHYLRAQGQPRKTLLRVVDKLADQVDLSQVRGVGLTGSGGGPIARLIGGHHVNEVVAQSRAVGHYHPEARTVIEIGGQDSKLLNLQWDRKSGRMILHDFTMNTMCAAGTGSFLDQQAERLGISVETEFGQLALQAAQPARIAGRCTVFAKSDMIHLQQKGTPLPDILAGLCLALARNFKSVIGKGQDFAPPILFQGGVAYNLGVVRAFETVLALEPGQLIVPQYHTLMAAIGTAFVTMDEELEAGLPPFRGFEPLHTAIQTGTDQRKTMPRLPTGRMEIMRGKTTSPVEGVRRPVYLGIDVGSVSTKAVLITSAGALIARRYLPTAGQPLEAVRRALAEIEERVGDAVNVMAVGTTGSGRYLTGDYVGADVIRNEITAQARAAIAIDPQVDTIFEIGGQDSKYISLDHEAVVDFTMNNACAAGTGSFLEEQAERLKVDIRDDFSRLAFTAACPAALGERCTVFMESDLIHHQQQGGQVEELTAGLAYSIAQNYLNRVVNGRRVGRHIFFQGGVAANKSVVAAFQQLTGQKITVPPHHEVTGAIGAALLAMEARPEKSNFKGFDLNERHYESSGFVCRACANLCEVNKVIISGEPPLFYGARCDKFEEAGRKTQNRAGDIPDLFAERAALLYGDYTPPNGQRNGRPRVAIPRALTFFDLFPYWRTFFKVLGMEIMLSSPTNPTVIKHTVEHAIAETCFPAKLVYGHVADLLDSGADYLFLPSMINRENIAPGQTQNNYCTFIPAMPHLVTAALDMERYGSRVIKVPVQMLWDRANKKNMKNLAGQLSLPSRRVLQAAGAAEQAQEEFYRALRRRGREVLAGLTEKDRAAVIVGRPYNTFDPGASQDLSYKLRKLGILPIPMDFLPLETVDLSKQYNAMHWRSGQDILAAASLVQADPRLQAIYLTNFNCGPDSFLLRYFRRIMGDKPFLELEVDEHTADAGIVTRCEAFFDSLAMTKGRDQLC